MVRSPRHVTTSPLRHHARQGSDYGTCSPRAIRRVLFSVSETGDGMTLRNVGQGLAALGLALALAGCGTSATVNGQQTSATSNVPATTDSAATVVVTQTVVVTSTVFATVNTSTTIPPVSTSASSTATIASSQATSAVAVSPASSSPTPAPHMTPTSAPGGLAITAASQVTLAFFGALQNDPSGTTSMKYLSSRLQADVRGGHSVASIVGIQNMYPHYQADPAISRGGGRAATVRVSLDYAAGPIQRLVTLIPENGAWHIDDIADSSA